MEQPLVSICIPTYNAVKYIDETINCFLNQSYKNLEIIIQDDCSTDGTWEHLIDNYQFNERVNLFSGDVNVGIGQNWNEAYKKARGSFVIIANADDIFFPRMIQTALDLFNEQKEIDAISFKYQILQQNNQVKRDIAYHSKIKNGIQENLFEVVLIHNPYHIIYTIFKKKVLNDLLLENNELFMNTQTCDAELILRFAKNRKKLFFSTDLMGFYRKHDTNNSSKPFGEAYSWIFDVIPCYVDYIRENCRHSFKNNIRDKIISHFKQSLKTISVPNRKYLTGLFKLFNSI